jgi:hypothetical protein
VKDDRVYLQHIRDALDDIATYTNVGRDAFFADRMRQDATLRSWKSSHRPKPFGRRSKRRPQPKFSLHLKCP